MKTMMMAVLAALAGSGSANVQGGPAPPLPPVGKWVVEYADNMCILSHGFGTGDAQVTLGFRPWPMGARTEVVLMARDSSSTASRGGKGATLSLSPGGRELGGAYWSYWLPQRKMRLVTLDVEQAGLADLDSASGVTIAIPKETRVSVTLPPNIKAALKALDKCDDDLLVSWGIDPAEKAMIAAPANPFPGNEDWINDNDYPADALRNNQQGTVIMVWTIGVDGRVSNCMPVIKSGVPLLDQAACNAVTRRGRYHPALNKDGKPIISHNTRKVIWRLPD